MTGRIWQKLWKNVNFGRCKEKVKKILTGGILQKFWKNINFWTLEASGKKNDQKNFFCKIPSVEFFFFFLKMIRIWWGVRICNKNHWGKTLLFFFFFFFFFFAEMGLNFTAPPATSSCPKAPASVSLAQLAHILQFTLPNIKVFYRRRIFLTTFAWRNFWLAEFDGFLEKRLSKIEITMIFEKIRRIFWRRCYKMGV